MVGIVFGWIDCEMYIVIFEMCNVVVFEIWIKGCKVVVGDVMECLNFVEG